MEAVTKKFYCTLCSAAFTRQDHLKRHAHTVHSFRPGLSCPNCEAHFTHGDDLLKHVSEGHRSENFTCKECSAQYNCYQKYSEHVATHSLLNPVNTCPHCSSVYKRRDHMLRHIKSKHLNQVFTCPICTQDYKRKDHMVRHVREKHHVYNHVEAFSVENRMEADTEKFYCTLCSATFTRQDHLKRHAHSVHSHRPGSSCPNCQAHFTHGDELQKHISEAHTTENFTCKECSAHYNCYQKYSEHTATHSLLDPANTCPHCSSVYKRRDHMLRHIKSKHLNQVFTCPICTQDYKRKDHMVRHVREKHHVYNHVEAFGVENRMEADTEKFYCTLCSATFTRQDHLKRHAHSVHSHRPGSSCPNCAAHFTHGDELQKHISEPHTTENFTCKECSAYYNCYQKYSEHTATHSLLDPANTCPHCSSVYKRRDHMLRHIKSKHLNQVFTCPICSQDYKRKDHMVRHVREKHHVYNHVEAFVVENRMEADTEKFYCTLCSATFTRQDHLKRHAHSVHSHRPGSSCPNCQAHFTHGDDLQKHISEAHTTENFTCKECSCHYNCYQKYSEHTATHSLLDPANTCPHCSSVYKRRDHMLRHIKSKHLNQVFTCPICTQDYKRKDHMVRHVRAKHHVYNHVEAFGVENR